MSGDDLLECCLVAWLCLVEAWKLVDVPSLGRVFCERLLMVDMALKDFVPGRDCLAKDLVDCLLLGRCDCLLACAEIFVDASFPALGFLHLLHPRPLPEKVDCDFEVLDIDAIQAVVAASDRWEFPDVDDC